MKTLVMDFGGTNIKYGLIDESYQLTNQGSLASPLSTKEELFAAVKSIYEQFKDQVAGVGMSNPGRIDSKKGFAYHGGAFQFIRGEFLQKEYEELLGCKVSIMNDAECALLAEARLGSCLGCQNAFAIIIGTGLGGALLINGQIYSGTNHNSGEISGYIVDNNAQGFSKFWMGHNSYRGLTATYETLKGLPIDSIDGKEFFKDIENDPEKLAILDSYAKEMALQIFNIQALLDVEKVVLGGGISKQPILIDSVNRETQKMFATYPFGLVAPEIVACKFANDANLLGAYLNFQDKYE